MSAFSSYLLFLLLSTILASSGHVSSQDHAPSVFILAGQSNMAGRGGVTNRTWCRPNPSIFRLSPGLRWERQGSHSTTASTSTTTAASDPASPAAKVRIRTRPVRRGATKITEWGGGTWLYNRTVQRSRKAVENSGTIRALLWYQGESDTIDLGDVRAYGARITQLIHDIRRDLNRPNLPIIQVSINLNIYLFIYYRLNVTL